jgi:hypothetical protein
VGREFSTRRFRPSWKRGVTYRGISRCSRDASGCADDRSAIGIPKALYWSRCDDIKGLPKKLDKALPEKAVSNVPRLSLPRSYDSH